MMLHCVLATPLRQLRKRKYERNLQAVQLSEESEVFDLELEMKDNGGFAWLA